MADYGASTVGVSLTPALAVESDNAKRTVVVSVDGNHAVYVGFTAAEVEADFTGFRVPMWNNGVPPSELLRFVLPANTELWVSGTGGALMVLVTAN